MPPQKRTRTQAKKNERQPVVPGSVLEEAAKMFLSSGYYRTRMQDIADSFGVTHAALYYHFRNKQDILAQINIRALQELLEGVREVAGSELAPATKFAAALRRHMAYVALNPGFVATSLEHDLEIPKPQLAKITKARREYTDVLRGLYEDAERVGAVPSIDSWIAVSLLLGACNWIYRWYDPSQGVTPDELVEKAMLVLQPILSSTAADAPMFLPTATEPAP